MIAVGAGVAIVAAAGARHRSRVHEAGVGRARIDTAAVGRPRVGASGSLDAAQRWRADLARRAGTINAVRKARAHHALRLGARRGRRHAIAVVGALGATAALVLSSQTRRRHALASETLGRLWRIPGSGTAHLLTSTRRDDRDSEISSDGDVHPASEDRPAIGSLEIEDDDIVPGSEPVDLRDAGAPEEIGVEEICVAHADDAPLGRYEGPRAHDLEPGHEVASELDDQGRLGRRAGAHCRGEHRDQRQAVMTHRSKSISPQPMREGVPVDERQRTSARGRVTMGTEVDMEFGYGRSGRRWIYVVTGLVLYLGACDESRRLGFDAGTDGAPPGDATDFFDAWHPDGTVSGDAGACAPMDAHPARPCSSAEDPAEYFIWNGSDCVSLSLCECAGADCDALFSTQTACEAAYGPCITGGCRRDTDCTFGNQWCVGGACVDCDNSGLACRIACLAGWNLYERNGCHPCECAPPNGCDTDGDCGSGRLCAPGRMCWDWCPAGNPSCCMGNVCVAEGCGTEPPMGCRVRGCPVGSSCVTTDTCAPSGCACDSSSGSWGCLADCGGGECQP